MDQGSFAPTSNQVEELKDAFLQFSQETERLEKAYLGLQERFQAVNAKLESTEELLQKKVVELDNISSYLQSVLGHLNEGILFIGVNGSISTCNHAAEKCLGTKAEHLLFKQYDEVFEDHFFGFSLSEAFKSSTVPTTTMISIEDKEFEVSLSFVSRGPKVYRGIIILLKDITEIRKLQKQSQLNDRMKELGEMAAFVAHEIRNPLGGILGYASLLKRELKELPISSEKVEHIIEGTQRLNQLVENVLHYARPLTLNMSCAKLCSLLSGLISFVQADMSLGNGVHFETHFSEECAPILIDTSLLYSAVLNLILNALQAMPEGGTLTLSCEQSERRQRITIRDTGVGIAQKDLDKVLSPFFTTKESGTGLGLSESYKIIQAHEGTLEITSEVGVGTTCLITLPMTEATCL